MIGILGGMGTQAGLDFCTKLAKINRGKADQNYPLFVLYNKATIPDRKKNLKKYKKVLKVKNAWRDTKKIIKNAKKAHKNQDYKKSVTLAKKALNEANMSYEQYEKQKDKYRFLD